MPTAKHLIELFLPLADNEGRPFSRADHQAVEQMLADKFGGVTAYPRAPASGRWRSSDSDEQHDDLIIYEVMAEELDESWWLAYRKNLQDSFHQERILIRCQTVCLL
jgi:hypothetical protein